MAGLAYSSLQSQRGLAVFWCAIRRRTHTCSRRHPCTVIVRVISYNLLNSNFFFRLWKSLVFVKFPTLVIRNLSGNTTCVSQNMAGGGGWLTINGDNRWQWLCVVEYMCLERASLWPVDIANNRKCSSYIHGDSNKHHKNSELRFSWCGCPSRSSRR